ncbi:hypothetical protein HGT73_07310 [Rosenbergiella australiborealis]|uniref:Uncharacterized protein n=1 Tax=Rosenbergiella australiborealis TaxID=1544696 RepID=A0ABS5T4B8_9GAMM|nr:hypothetical protein [Rosenbergiella australiborealis]MBT0727191.1 hypothetical protein [Rosenbergiella australiborealis]
MSEYDNDLYETLFASRQRPFPEESTTPVRRRSVPDEGDYNELQFND